MDQTVLDKPICACAGSQTLWEEQNEEMNSVSHSNLCILMTQVNDRGQTKYYGIQRSPNVFCRLWMMQTH